MYWAKQKILMSGVDTVFFKKQKINETDKNETNDIIILHRSQPYLQHDKYCDLNEFKELFKDYELFFILCTRYHVISNHSKKHRFQRREDQLIDNYDISKKILTEITKTERFLYGIMKR